MPPVDLIAVKSFVYKTRRLMPEEHFQAKNAAEAGVLVDLAKKARYGRTPGKVVAPPEAVAAKIEEKAPAKAEKPAVQREKPKPDNGRRRRTKKA